MTYKKPVSLNDAEGLGPVKVEATGKLIIITVYALLGEDEA